MKDMEKREISLRYDTTVANVTSQQLWLPAWGLDKTEPINSQDSFMGALLLTAELLAHDGFWGRDNHHCLQLCAKW